MSRLIATKANVAISYKLKARQGFTLIEVLISFVVLLIFVGAATVLTQPFQAQGELEAGVDTLVTALHRAQVLSRAVAGESSWGVRVNPNQIIVFKGSSYAARDTSVDEVSELSSTVTPTGLLEVVFSQLTGEPQQTGTTTLTSRQAEIRTVFLNAKGTVSY